MPAAHFGGQWLWTAKECRPIINTDIGDTNTDIGCINILGRKQMNKMTTVALTGVGLLLAATAQADVAINAVRIGGTNVAALAKFYESAYGLQEIRRLATPGHLEIMLNFGDSVAAAKANPAAHIIIEQRDQAGADPGMHLTLKVTDMTATVAAVKASGGSIVAPPHEVGKSGILSCVVIDPDGNHVEIIQRPSK